MKPQKKSIEKNIYEVSQQNDIYRSKQTVKVF